ncbi:MAG: O-antigen ligase family protein [Candidatus Pacebacteria bacterium]|nr:O-antigen ligase family protein [Candidatus Paceibacterota bacterium]
METVIKQIINKKIGIIFALILTAEVLSFLAYIYPSLSAYFFLLVIVLATYLGIKNLKYLFFFSLAELIIGSQGRLFFLDLPFFSLSLRMALWALMLIFFFFYLLKNLNRKKVKEENQVGISLKNKPFYEFRYLSVFLLLMFFIFLGALIGVLSGHDLGVWLADFNAWLFLAWLFPVVYIFRKNPGEKILYETLTVFIAACLWLVFKSLFFLFIFSHDFFSLMGPLYRWSRVNYLGEITALQAGFYRIFFQSHLYSLIAVILSWVALEKFKKLEFKQSKYIYLFLVLNLSAVLLSLSRSLWMGLAFFLLFYFLFKLRSWKFKQTLKRFMVLLSLFLMAFLVIAFVAKVPVLGQSGEFSAKDILKERSSTEADAGAISSRWSLLSPLSKKILKAPVFGQGFGQEITYISQDPRVLESNPSGTYTTYAFEWAWLDVWLKIGFLGLLAYFWLLYRLIADSFKTRAFQPLVKALGWSLMAIAIVNIFTPYYNHPLGLGFLVVSAVIITRSKNIIYER